MSAYLRNPVAWLFIVSLALTVYAANIDAGIALFPGLLAFICGILLLEERYGNRNNRKGIR